MKKLRLFIIIWGGTVSSLYAMDNAMEDRELQEAIRLSILETEEQEAMRRSLQNSISTFEKEKQQNEDADLALAWHLQLNEEFENNDHQFISNFPVSLAEKNEIPLSVKREEEIKKEIQKGSIPRLKLEQLIDNSNFMNEAGRFLMDVQKERDALYHIDQISARIRHYEYSLNNASEDEQRQIQRLLDAAREELLEKETQSRISDFSKEIEQHFVYTDPIGKQEYRFTKEQSVKIVEAFYNMG